MYRSKPKQRRNFTLYWSSMTMYEDCPQKYLWSRGWPGIDLGQGPGRPKKKPIRRSEHHAVMGIVLADFWEWLYNDEEWRHPGFVDRLLEKARKEFDRLCMTKYIDWRLAPDRDELWTTIENGIRGYVRTMKENRLLGPYARSEVDLTAYIDKYTPVGGRADLIIRRPDTGITILDGKNSRRYKNPRKTGPRLITYTDPDQLRWYAMCFYLAYRKMPDRLGFVYFRYPFGDPVLDENGEEVDVFDEDTGLPTGEVERETGVDWVPFDKDDLKGIARRAKDALRGMNREKFEATPVPSKCKFCDFETVCPERQAQRKKNSRKRKKSSDFFDGQVGFVRFGMGKGGSVVVKDE